MERVNKLQMYCLNMSHFTRETILKVPMTTLTWINGALAKRKMFNIGQTRLDTRFDLIIRLWIKLFTRRDRTFLAAFDWIAFSLVHLLTFTDTLGTRILRTRSMHLAGHNNFYGYIYMVWTYLTTQTISYSENVKINYTFNAITTQGCGKLYCEQTIFAPL